MTETKSSALEVMTSALHKRERSLQACLPADLKLDRFIEEARLYLVRHPGVLQCTEASILQAVYAAAETGLHLSPGLDEAYLVPFKGTCTFIPGYRGLVRLASQSPAVAGVDAQIVREGDAIEIVQGTRPKLVHRPSLLKKGEMVGAYAVVWLASGYALIEWMGLEELERIRARSPSARSGKQSPYDTDPEEMARKAPLRRILKRAPKTTRAAMALASLDEADQRADRAATDEPVVASHTIEVPPEDPGLDGLPPDPGPAPKPEPKAAAASNGTTYGDLLEAIRRPAEGGGWKVPATGAVEIRKILKAKGGTNAKTAVEALRRLVGRDQIERISDLTWDEYSELLHRELGPALGQEIFE